MKARRSLLLLLLLPVLLVGLFAVVVMYGALVSLYAQFDRVSVEQTSDLAVIEDAAGFSRDIGLIQKRMAVALQGAMSGELDELQLYRMHTAIVNDLHALSARVEQLVTSELVIDANHNSARGLREEFEGYRRFLIMTTDVLAVDASVAADFMEQARVHFREFSIFSSRIVTLLAHRSQERNQVQQAAFHSVFEKVLWSGLLSLLVLLVVTAFIARHASSRMLAVADALSALSGSAGSRIPLPQIEAMHRGSRGEFARIAATLLAFRDEIERRRKAEEEAFQLAFYDPLTRLPNRRLLLERLDHALSVAESSGNHTALVMLDLDDFKSVNDSRGHGFGDRLLIEVAARLLDSVRESDTVARLGGDEFAIIIESLSARPERAVAEIERHVSQVIRRIGDALEIEGETVFTSASMGITLFGQRPESMDDPLKHAETAMYQAKADGRNTFRFYDPAVQARLEARISLERELRLSVEREELRLYYQVQVDQRDEVRGVEALVRWMHPERGLVPPGEFIPLAESSDLILGIGHWVLHTACRTLKRWEGDPRCAGMSMSVNVSARQFRQEGFVDEVLTVLRETGANPQRLKLELTESTVLEDVELTIARMQQLREAGVRFSMDDFGTGYSSLQYLKRLPLDQLKIDQSFVRDILRDSEDAVIVQTIIAMSHALGLEVIAEGVETREHQDFLQRQGCWSYQGYLYGRPVPLDELEAVIRTPAAA